MWEKIKDTILGQVESHRLKVPGGWIVRTIVFGSDETSVTQTYIEDISHTWTLKD